KKRRRLDFRERIAVEATAYLSMAALVNAAKYTFREKRPDSSARNSFPSGHTATAFTGAELIRMEFGWGYGSAAYVISTGVAFLRIYNDRHWLNDVLAGAGFGILSAHIGYWMLPLYRKWFHWEKISNQQSFIAAPAYSTGELSLNLLYTF
ncbi:MAG: phosphatase PAP2 family protein, partial [Muribaculaceae bacterium]|nr:phosphatase PAP2 family protein [Muribaculaceae bacterium]